MSSSDSTSRIERGLVRTSFGYLHYRTAGEGSPLVMLHSSPRSSAMLVPAMAQLSQQLRCYAFDTLGYGDSDRPGRQLSIEEYADSVREAMANLGINDAAVLGHATGAYIGIGLAVGYPEAVRKLVLQTCPYYLSEEMVHARHSAALAAYQTDSTGFPLPRTLEEVYEKDMAHSPRVPTQEWLDQENIDLIKPGRSFWDAMIAVKNWVPVFGEKLTKIKCPTLLVMGKDFLYTQQLNEFTSRIPNLRVALLDQAGYFGRIDNPEVYDRAILGFLTSAT